MARLLPDAGQLLVLALLVGTPAALFVALRTVPGLDVLFQSVRFHLFVVSAIAACALVVAILVAVAAGRARRFSLVMLALGCLGVGFFMLAHGLTTPGIWNRPFNWWVARYPSLALTAFAVCLAGAVFAGTGRVARWVERHARGVIAVSCALLAVAIIPTLLWPTAGIGSHLLSGENLGTKVAGAVCAIILFASGEAHRRRWQLSRDEVELALLVACWLSMESVASLQLGRLWHLSWWDYHVLLLLGFGATVYAIVAGYGRSRSVDGALAGVTLRDKLDRIQHGYPDAVRSLVTAVEAKDSYTKGHSNRVAELSVRIGEHLGAKPDLLRALAQGGLLHDIGKIGVPDQILNKSGVLTPEERAEIERHPTVGWDIVRQSPSLRKALVVVRHHHERMDGRGYPDRLAGADIPLEAQIAAVADVWDALTSDRAYRPAWPVERALDLMRSERGMHFAPDPLDALLELLDGEGIRSSGPAVAGEGEGDGEACHPAPMGRATVNVSAPFRRRQ